LNKSNGSADPSFCFGVCVRSFAEYVENVDGVTQNATLKAGDYFGDEVLLDEHRYAGTVISLQTTSCWSIDRGNLKQTLNAMKTKKQKKAGSDNVA